MEGHEDVHNCMIWHLHACVGAASKLGVFDSGSKVMYAFVLVSNCTCLYSGSKLYRLVFWFQIFHIVVRFPNCTCLGSGSKLCMSGFWFQVVHVGVEVCWISGQVHDASTLLCCL